MTCQAKPLSYPNGWFSWGKRGSWALFWNVALFQQNHVKSFGSIVVMRELIWEVHLWVWTDESGDPHESGDPPDVKNSPSNTSGTWSYSWGSPNINVFHATSLVLQGLIEMQVLNPSTEKCSCNRWHNLSATCVAQCTATGAWCIIFLLRIVQQILRNDGSASHFFVCLLSEL